MNHLGRNARRAAGAVVTAAFVASCAAAPTTVPLDLPAANDATPSATPVARPVTPGKSTNSATYSVTVDRNVPRDYRMHVPLTAPPGPRPLIIMLHGGGSRPQTVQYNIGLDSVADRLGLYVAYPEAVGGHWNDGRKDNVVSSGGVNDVHFIETVIKDVRKRQPVDLSRVFVVGHGDGGIEAACFARARPNLVAGIGMISSQLPDSTGCKLPDKRLSVLLVHGTADPLFPSKGSVKDGLQSLPATLRYFRSLDGLTRRGASKKMTDRDRQDGTTVVRTVWGEPTKHLIAYYSVKGGGYPWPGGESSSRSLARLGRTSRDLDTSGVVGHFALDVRPAG